MLDEAGESAAPGDRHQGAAAAAGHLEEQTVHLRHPVDDPGEDHGVEGPVGNLRQRAARKADHPGPLRQGQIGADQQDLAGVRE